MNDEMSSNGRYNKFYFSSFGLPSFSKLSIIKVHSCSKKIFVILAKIELYIPDGLLFHNLQALINGILAKWPSLTTLSEIAAPPKHHFLSSYTNIFHYILKH